MASTSLRIALVQFNVTWENSEANFNQLESLLHFESPVDMVILPEMWSTGFTMNPGEFAEKEPGPALERMLHYAHHLDAVITGSIAVEENGKYYNRWYGVYPDGRTERYDKRHLFSFGKEDRHYTPGNERKVPEIKGWRFMPVICYDLRFPVWCRNDAEYDILIVVANWPTPRIHHWDTLLKARAIENQSYVVAVNRIGTDGAGLHYPGHSSVIDMGGTVLMDMKDKEGIVIVTLEKDALDQYRDHFRFLQDRDRFDIR